MKKLFNYFQFDTRQAILKKEIIGGLSTFLAMVYILAVNPSIVGDAPLLDGTNATAAQYRGGLFLATALSAFIGTLVMGLFANLPIGLAPGMGLNAFFAYNVATHIGFESALSVTILSGFLYFIVVMTPARNFISKKIPKNIKLAIGAGIGFFIAYLGLQSSGIILAGDPGTGLATKLNDLKNPMVILAVILLFVGLILYYLKIPGAIIITMILGAIILLILKLSGLEQLKNSSFFANYDDFSSFPKVITSGWKGFGNAKMWASPMTYIAILSFVYLDFFDTTGTLIALNKMVDLDEKDPNWMKKANNIDAISTIVGASIGATTVTSFVESVVGVSAGAKTGFSNIIVALGFALAIPAWPILQIFLPINIETVSYQPIVGPILILIGTIMITQIKFFEWEIAIDIPMLFLTIILMTLTNSIATGIAISSITFVILNSAAGFYQLLKGRKKVIETMSINFAEDTPEVKTREFKYWKRLNWAIILIAAFSLLYLVVEQIIPLIK